MLLQIQEMLRTERITREAAIQHEIDTYNELIPGKDELFATVMIEIADKDEREAFLARRAGSRSTWRSWWTASGSRATWEKARELEDRASAVHYLHFSLSPKAAAPSAREEEDARGSTSLVDHPAYAARATLSRRRPLASLAEDLDE